jgi:quercetin dioxygenase-like cupin family protein
MKNIRTFLILALAFLLTALGSAQVASQTIELNPKAASTAEVVLTSEIEWGPLNPARGDQSPRAGKLWGDRTGSGPSGFLVQFVDGFSSPPHIHNVTYRGVVISGLVHNDDPGAEDMWLPAGSFWTQPAGEVHITSADANSNVAYIEIEEGPYLVLPSKEAFDNGERPINVDKSNLIWLDASNIAWLDQAGMPPSADGPKIAFLWGTPQQDQLNGTFVKLPDGFTGKIDSHGSTFRAVVIQGQPSHHLSNETDVKTLKPGSYFGSEGETVHQVSCETGEECIIYVRTEGKFDVVQA